MCDYQTQLLPYLEKQLTPTERAALQAHLNTCVTCQAELDDLQRLVGELQAVPIALNRTTPMSHWAGVQQRLNPSWQAVPVFAMTSNGTATLLNNPTINWRPIFAALVLTISMLLAFSWQANAAELTLPEPHVALPVIEVVAATPAVTRAVDSWLSFATDTPPAVHVTDDANEFTDPLGPAPAPHATLLPSRP